MLQGRDFSQLINLYTPYCSSSVESLLLSHMFNILYVLKIVFLNSWINHFSASGLYLSNLIIFLFVYQSIFFFFFAIRVIIRERHFRDFLSFKIQYLILQISTLELEKGYKDSTLG